MKVLIRKLGNIIQKICYPSICEYCHKLCNDKRTIFCTECFYLINLLDQEGRCPSCFSMEDERHYCKASIKQIYVSEKEGPIDALLQKVLKGQHYRVPAIAALMAYQYLRLNLPLPDYIVPSSGKKLPISLAKEMGKILQVPYCRIFLQMHAHVLLASFQMDQSYDAAIEKLQKIHPKTLTGITLFGADSNF